GGVLFEPEVDVGERGDLRQGGDADDLVLGPERPQTLADDPRRVAADPAAGPSPLSASMTRESSPPEAASRSGAGSIPGLGATRSSTVSRPEAPCPSGWGSRTTSSRA